VSRIASLIDRRQIQNRERNHRHLQFSCHLSDKGSQARGGCHEP
jgi:hypothetical protein